MFGAFYSVSERLNIPFKELALASDENQVCLQVFIAGTSYNVLEKMGRLDNFFHEMPQ